MISLNVDVGAFEVPGGALAVVLSPDAGHVVATGPLGYALWRRSDGRTTVRESVGPGGGRRLGRRTRVAVASGRRALVPDADRGELWRTEPAASPLTDLAWMRQGRRLAVAA
ncbi:hypothetical protein GCM10010260_58250 [Streptomyces filipinensis]|uniref:Uncharacterized protein n=1 Tax=Streptomyces filipinensis TaxID=66887 RepID=A0A918IGP6_9ACTN|nr:hypothetical protein [Streptomyces filipinensis]GGV12004.1 hypothetical protein GCM10010260_58250 [Streptomyces filipinensis]